MQSVTTGIVIRRRSMGDDRLVTLLTEDFGVLSAFAKGADRPRSKLCAATELFCASRVTLFRYRDSVTLDTAEPLCSFFELRGDLTSLALASYIAELCCELAPREEGAADYLSLTLNCLHLLKEHKRPLSQLKAIFELRLLTMAGYMPDLTGCAGCGKFDGTLSLVLDSGELCCADCRPPAASLPLAEGVLAAMRHIVYSDSQKLFSFTLSQEGLAALGDVVERYLKHHLQRGFPTLDFYHTAAQ